jgi:hypothetical protein
VDHSMQGNPTDVLQNPPPEPMHTPFGDYELVQRGLIGPDLVSELLLTSAIAYSAVRCSC